MLKLLLIRHGESTYNRERRMAGRLNDPLTPRGAWQCQCLAQQLYRQGWSPSHLYTSPLRRAIASLACLLTPWQWRLPDPLQASLLGTDPAAATPLCSQAQLAQLPVTGPHPTPLLTVTPNLSEFDAGILTGLTWAAAQQRYPALCQALETAPHWVPIPEAETPDDGRRRAAAFQQHLLSHHRNGDRIWVITHQWILEHIVASWLGCDRTWQLPMPNTAVFEFWIDRDRWSEPGMVRGISHFWQVKRFGDCHHLSVIPSPHLNSAS